MTDIVATIAFALAPILALTITACYLFIGQKKSDNREDLDNDNP